jgi:hypothetical protein
MANVYVDLDKSASTEDGTTWANAFRLPSEIVVGAGDDVWIKGNTNTHSGSVITVDLIGPDSSNPAKVHAVATATSAEPPTASDLISGWRTGDARTLANRAYKDAAAPRIEVTTNHLLSVEVDYAYGVEFRGSGGGRVDIGNPADDSDALLEECLITQNGANQVRVGEQASSGALRLLNCGYETGNISATLRPYETCKEIIGLEHIATSVPTTLLATITTVITHFIGCDFSGASGNILSITAVKASRIFFQNCQLHASATLLDGTEPGGYRLEFHHTLNVTGKSSGTIQDISITTEAGNIVEETTAVRTGGADDGGAGGWSLAFTPVANETRDNYRGLYGPWMAFKITGDGTAKTVSVSIANSGAADYNNDDVWLEVMYPSEGGTAQYDNQTSQMDLLGTPTAITDDTGSAWGGGVGNHQTLSVSIAPEPFSCPVTASL